MREDYQRFVDLETEVIIIGPEKKEAFERYWKEEKLPFIGIPDPDHSLAGLYGQEVKIVKLGRMPAQMVVDKAGALRYVHYGQSMKDIPPNEEILGVIGGLAGPST